VRSEKRRAIRLTVLKDLYRAYKTDRQKRRTIPLHVEFDDPETFFALEYLAEKKLVYFKQTNPEYYIVKITPLGKSFLETEQFQAEQPQPVACGARRA
jgi:predicted transcriptional regulator